MKKHDRELAILRMIYDEKKFASVQHQDRPDFLLRHHGASTNFGVEVTELYQTESDARANNRPGYIGQLLAGGRYMHKDDTKTLSISTVKIQDSEGNLKADNVSAIIRQQPSERQRSQAIAEVVHRKNEKADGYLEGLDHVNLIIMDHFGLKHEPDSEYSVSRLLTSGLRPALLETRFREVFLISTLSDGRKIYRPLQMLLLVERFQLFIEAINSCDAISSAIELNDIVPLFVRQMNRSGMCVELASHVNDFQCAIYRGAGIFHTGEMTEILDFYDMDLPSALPLPPVPVNPETMAIFEKGYEKLIQKNGFVTPLVMDVVEESDL
ncbi:hypothetical protein ABZU75_28195 [Streptosporangium sp. NPDC005286]|uniref:hypothetical protein n=1 Tax=Streptosporangium sp. NPDC005286 TaxID=3154463 RepID=UPI0033A407BB